LPFIFDMSPCLIRFDTDSPSQLRDAVTLGRSSLYIRTAATEIVTKKIAATKAPTYLGFVASAAAPLMLLHPVR
jgi:hypothetical protein